MDWFERLTGFAKTATTRAREAGGRRTQSRSLVNGKSYGIGEFELASLRTLRERAASVTGTPRRNSG